MASKKNTGTEAGSTKTGSDPASLPGAEEKIPPNPPLVKGGMGDGATGPPASDYVVIANRTQGNLPCHLSNGKVVNLGPRVPGRALHRSEPVLRKLLTPLIQSWKRQRMADIEPYQGGE